MPCACPARSGPGSVCVVWRGVAWCGVVCCGMAWCGVAWHRTLGMSSSQTPLSRSGGLSVSYRTSSLSHLKTVSFLVFATWKTEPFVW